MSRPNWMVENVVAGLQDLVATLDSIAASNAVDAIKAQVVTAQVGTGPAPSLSVPAATAAVSGISAALVALYNALPVLVSGVTGVDPSVVPALFSLARGIGGAMDPADAAAAFAYAVDALPDAPPPPTSAQNRIDDAANMEIVARVGRMVLLAPYAEALTAIAFATRADGVTARVEAVDRYGREIDLSTGPGGGDLSVRLAASRDSVVEYLSQVITTLAPVITVSAQVSLPSLVWAWKLYRDPTRAPELVARNSVPHPSYMPLRFEALAPSS